MHLCQLPPLASGHSIQVLWISPVLVLHLLQEPRRILCTGYGNGGALAQLCGVWAAVTYPLAQVRTITYGAPTVRLLHSSF